jgi:hypothetical protein
MIFGVFFGKNRFQLLLASFHFLYLVDIGRFISILGGYMFSIIYLEGQIKQGYVIYNI